MRGIVVFLLAEIRLVSLSEVTCKSFGSLYSKVNLDNYCGLRCGPSRHNYS